MIPAHITVAFDPLDLLSVSNAKKEAAQLIDEVVRQRTKRYVAPKIPPEFYKARVKRKTKKKKR